MASRQQASIPFTPALVHPGEIVSEYIEFHGWTQRDLARRTGLTPKTISEILNGKAPVMKVIRPSRKLPAKHDALPLLLPANLTIQTGL